MGKLAAEVVLTSAIQISMGIAGFTGIILAVAGGAKVGTRERISLSILLLASIATVTMSFLPMILLNAGVGEGSTWMASSIIFVVYFTAITSYRFYEYRRAGTAMPIPLSVGIAFLGLCAVLQVVNAILIRQSWPYLILVVCYVIYSFLVFAYLLWTLWSE